MTPNESRFEPYAGCAPPDVESMLKQMSLRGPSERLDHVIADLSQGPNRFEPTVLNPKSFGWTAMLCSTAAAMLVGITLGCLFMSQGSDLGNSEIASSSSLTNVSFSVDAFELLHGHSGKAEFENCEQCHKKSIDDVAAGGIFKDWFYGDGRFFETHRDGRTECAKCHVGFVDDGVEFARLSNCASCHVASDEGFGGFENDWRS